MKKKIRPADFLIALLLILSVYISYRFLSSQKQGYSADIEFMNSRYANWPLSTNDRKVDTIAAANGQIIVERENGAIWISSAPCPDRVCVHTGRIKRAGEKIICVPNKLVITIESDESEYDAIVE
ncbi:MAG: NusG domain II-containing protein [Fibrobacteres bacterium]|nr:NusG domain II-containing protein [Fibrobacterota bacterium]